MADVIVSRAHIRAKARAAFDASLSRDSHNMNPGAAALFDWFEEYDRCAAQMNHIRITSNRRVDAAQASTC